MKSFYNSADDYVTEMLRGIFAAHPASLKSCPGNIKAVIRADAPVKGKVAIITGGGSGHLPTFMGYVGKGFADGAAVGNVFASPSAGQMLTVARAAHGGEGCLFLFGNYAGDVMNFSMAAEEAEAAGIRVKSVIAADDIASSPDPGSRRGVAGIFFAYKVAGACADKGMSLDEVAAETRSALDDVRSLGVAIGACTLPGASGPNFQLAEGEMEIGMGIHGERGIARTQRRKAQEVVDEMMSRLLDDLKPQQGTELAILVNSFGATPLEELYIAFDRIAEIARTRELCIYRSFVGRYATSLEMAGFSISLFRLNARRKLYLDHPAWTPFIREGSGY